METVNYSQIQADHIGIGSPEVLDALLAKGYRWISPTAQVHHEVDVGNAGFVDFVGQLHKEKPAMELYWPLTEETFTHDMGIYIPKSYLG